MTCWYCESEIMDGAGNGEWRVMSSIAVAPDEESAHPARPVAVCIECSETCKRCGRRAPFGSDPHEASGGLCGTEEWTKIDA